MAFEAEIGGRVFLLDVLDGAAAFDAADCEAGGVSEAGDDAGLPFQRGLHGFVNFCGFLQVYDVDIAICGGNNEQLILHVHAVYAFLAV